MLLLSAITIFAIIISTVSSCRVKEIKKELQSIKGHEAKHSREQIKLLKKLLKILEKSHPKIFEEITNETTNNDNIIDIKHKCKG